MPDARAMAVALALGLAANLGLPFEDGVRPAVQAPRLAHVAPPASLPPALRLALENECVTTTLPAGGVLRLWPARKVSPASPPAPDEPLFLRERVRSSIEPGSLIAVATWEAPWRDYRDQPIPAGTYALIYEIQPEFKQHRAVSEFRDALLLVRPDALPDRDPGRLVAASRAVSGASHPAVAALFPVDPGAKLPDISRRSDGGMTLEFEAGVFRLGLAVSGHGRVEDVEP